MPTKAPKNQKESTLLSIKSRSKQETSIKPSKIVYIKGEVIKRHSSSCKLMCLAILSLEYSISNQSTHILLKIKTKN